MAEDSNFLGNWYAAGLAEYENKSCCSEDIAKHLGKISNKIGLDKCLSLLSIGPGPGYVDVPLIRDYLSDLEHYCAVDVRADALQELKPWIQMDIGDRTKCELIVQNVENWSGPPDGVKVDVILMIHVLYYITDKQTLMKKCLDWLKPGGLLIIGLLSFDVILPRCAQYVNPETCQSYTSVQVVEDLHAVGISSWTEERIPLETDVREPKKVLVDFILHKEAAATEVEKFKELTTRFAPSGLFYEENQIFIITK